MDLTSVSFAPAPERGIAATGSTSMGGATAPADVSAPARAVLTRPVTHRPALGRSTTRTRSPVPVCSTWYWRTSGRYEKGAPQVERVDGDLAARRRRQSDDVVAAPVDALETGERPAGGVRPIGDGDRVRELVANERLGPVPEVRQQHVVARRPGWHGLVSLVDGLEDDHVLPHVATDVRGAFAGHHAALRRDVDVDDLEAPGLARPSSDLVAQHLGSRRGDRRRDGEPTVELLLGQQAQDRRVGDDSLRAVGLEPVHDLVDRLCHGEGR